jgi:hypothetical protein
VPTWRRRPISVLCAHSSFRTVPREMGRPPRSIGDAKLVQLLLYPPPPLLLASNKMDDDIDDDDDLSNNNNNNNNMRQQKGDIIY